uniref:TIR domain-containing protein n=1 Tax=Ictidomys tridecemlineatus TaxID=43179 RepID=I3MYM5_ICTTR
MSKMERRLVSAVLPLLLLDLMDCDLMSQAWTVPDCTIADSSLLSNLSFYIPFCPLAPGLHIFASCSNVTDLTQTLRAVPQDIQALCLQGMVPVLPANAFGHSPFLQLLRLQLGTLKIISEAFQGLNRLQYLSFEHHAPCCLSLFLPPDALVPLTFLSSLSFQGYCLNYSQNIQLMEISSCCSLEHLSLYSNGLKLLPIKFLNALPQLQSLNLSMNKLGPALVLPDGLVSTNLRVLDLSNNELCVLPYGAFSFIPQLEKLWLSGNNISNLSSESLEGLKQLKTLDLSWNKIKVLKPDWLSFLPALTSLNLLGTYLSHIPGKELQGPQRLSHLQLGSLQMLDFYPPWPLALLSLEIWAETGIWFNNFNEDPFLFLEKLILQTSKVVLSPYNTSVHFPSLRHLTLRGVSFFGFSSQQSQRSFPQFPVLEHLHFWSDYGSTENLQLFGMPKLRELGLGDLNFHYESRSTKLELVLKEVPQLQVLALSHLNLGNLSMSSFRDLDHLQLLLFNSEWTLGLDSNLQELIPQMPQYVYFSDVTFTCQCESFWVGPWATQAPNTFVYGLEKSICMANASDYSKTPLLSFLSHQCARDLEFQGFLASFTLVLLFSILVLLGCPKWSWLHHLRTLFHVWWWKLCGRGPRSQFHYDVFISYCEQDQDWVLEELVPTLEKSPPAGEGLRLCLPERDFGVGQDRLDALVASMENCRAILCVLSNKALGSPQCHLELRLATYHLVARPGTACLLFLEPIDGRKWLQKEDYFDLPQGRVEWDVFCEQLRKRLRKAGQERDD